MPIYEYRCHTCGHTFEAFQRLGADGHELTCPVCNAVKPEKIFSAFAACGSASSTSASSNSGCNGSSGFS